MMKYRISMLAASIVYLISDPAFSQSAARIVDHNNNGWYFYIGNYRLSDKFGLSTELHFRRANIITDPQQFLFRPSANYFVNDHLVLTLGYTYVLSYPYGAQPLPTEIPENNIWEQVTLKHDIGKVNLQHRYRLEERWVGVPVAVNNDYEIDGTTYSNRLRYRLTVHIPVVTFSEEKHTSLFITIFDELWIDMNDDLSPKSINQNWFYSTLGYQFNAHGNVQVGFLQQYLPKADGIHVENNPTLQVGLFYNFDFRN